MADENGAPQAPVKCPECPPGLPGWMATFSDLVTLLLTFFVLLLSFAKTESAKYEAALGSLRKQFGGNVLKHGEVIQRGKSADDQPTMLESDRPLKPFPIEFLTMEGILDKHEINRESTEQLSQMKDDLRQFDLSENVNIYEMPEGIKVVLKDKIYFKESSIVPNEISVEVFEKLVKMMREKDWTLFVLGHASRGETNEDGTKDAYELSSIRSMAVMRSLVRRGVRPAKITPVFYGDTRPDIDPSQSGVFDGAKNRRVEFILRKTDLQTQGHKTDSY